VKCRDKLSIWIVERGFQVLGGQEVEGFLIAFVAGNEVSYGFNVTKDRDTLRKRIKEVCGGNNRGATDVETHGVGMFPIDLVAVHLDSDDAIDVIVANQDSNNLAVMKGISGGQTTASSPSFQDSVYFDTGQHPVQIATGDFNRDGKLDVVTVNRGDFIHGDLSLLLGNGNATFETAISLAAGDRPIDLEVGDLDRDGNLDLLVADDAQPRLVFLAGLGNGAFSPAIDIPLAQSSSEIDLVDLDQDLNLDVVTRNQILLGKGDGTFEAPRNYANGLALTMRHHDVNADGNVDLITLNPSSQSVSILLGDGAGNLDLTHRYLVGSFPEQVAIDDVDGDGALDLMISNFSADHLSILYGRGDGSFLGAPIYGLLTAFDAGLGHFDDDSHLDVALARLNRDAAIFPGSGDGAFGSPVFLPDQDGDHVVSGNFDADRYDDLAFSLPSTFGTDLEIRLGKGNLDFEPRSPIELPENGSSAEFMLPTYVDSDQHLDLVVINLGATGVSVLLGDGNGGFDIEALLPTGPYPQTLAVGQIDGNATLDLAVVSQGTLGSLNGDVRIFLGNGSGGFVALPPILTGTTPNAVAIADLDLDGFQDLVVNLESPQFTWRIQVLYGRGDGTFESPVDTFPPASADILAGLVAVDLTGNGIPELISSTGGGEISILVANQGRTFFDPIEIDSGQAGAPATADIDGDGWLDLVLPISSADGGFGILLNRTGVLHEDPFESGDLSTWSSTTQ
jgi:hypothetical protein